MPAARLRRSHAWGRANAAGHGGRAGDSAMQLIDQRLAYSATDLVGFLECRHLANLERAATLRHLKRPFRDDPVLDRMSRRGQEYEARFLEMLSAEECAWRKSDRPTRFPRPGRSGRNTRHAGSHANRR